MPQPIRNAQTGQFETVYSVVCLPSDQTSCITCGFPLENISNNFFSGTGLSLSEDAPTIKIHAIKILQYGVRAIAQ